MKEILKLSGLLMFLLGPLQVYGQCSGNGVDLILAVPGSTSVSEFEFQEYEDNLIDLLRHFAIEPSQFNVGLILYGATAIPMASLRPFKTRTKINTRVTLLTQRMMHLHAMGGYNDVANAIDAMITMFDKPPKRSVRIGVVFTFGPSSAEDVPRVVAAATRAKSANILMYALGANGSNEDFSQIGTDYCRLFSMGDVVKGLPSAVPYLASSICSELDPTVIITVDNCFPQQYPKAPRIGVSCQVEGNMMQADPNNCAYYYQCEYFDKNPKRVKCGLNTLYDPLTHNCNILENVACYKTYSCPNDKPGLHPHPTDCRRFINCFNDFIPHVQSCPPDQVFDSLYQTCNHTDFGQCIHRSEAELKGLKGRGGILSSILR